MLKITIPFLFIIWDEVEYFLLLQYQKMSGDN